MRIAELEEHHDQYVLLESRIQSLLGVRDVYGAFAACLASYPHIEPAIRYRKKREITPITPRIIAFDIVIHYAPVFFEHELIESLVATIESSRFLSRHEHGFRDAARAALDREEVARRIWNHLDREDKVQDLVLADVSGVHVSIVDSIVRTWEQFDIVRRMPIGDSEYVSLKSRLDSVVDGICPACGARGRGRKELFFKEVTCGRCRSVNCYHIVAAIEQENLMG